MVSALAEGQRVLGDERYGTAARRAADFLMGRLATPEGRHHQPVPGGDDLVVEGRRHPQAACRVDEQVAMASSRSAGERPSTAATSARGSGTLGMLLPSQFPALGDVVVRAEPARQLGVAHRLAHLGGRPHEEAALLALGVGVGGGVEAALGRGRSPATRGRGSRRAIRAGRRRWRARLVTLEAYQRARSAWSDDASSRNAAPASVVHRVAEEPAAHLVVHATTRHFGCEGDLDHLQRVAPRRRGDDRAGAARSVVEGGNFGASPKPPQRGSKSSSSAQGDRASRPRPGRRRAPP